MAAPRGVKLEEDIFLVVDDDFLVVVGYHNLDITFLFLGDWLGLDAWLDLARDEIVDELANVFCCELLALVKGEFLILDGFLDRKGGPFIGFEVQVGGVCAKSLGVNSGEADSTLVLLSKGL